MNKKLMLAFGSVLIVLLLMMTFSQGITGNAIFPHRKIMAHTCDADAICEGNSFSATTGSITAQDGQITNRLDVDDLRAVRTEFQNNIFAPGISSINPSGLYLSGIGGIYHSAQYNNPATGSGTSYNVLALRPIAPQTISTVQFPQITGNGNAYACLDSQGYLYRSNAPCI